MRGVYSVDAVMRCFCADYDVARNPNAMWCSYNK